MSNTTLEPDAVNKYNTSAKICGLTMKHLIRLIENGTTLDVKELCSIGNRMIESECSKIFKKEKGYKGVAFPTCLSLNNCVGYYTHEKGNDKYNTITSGDIVKIELGATIGEHTAVLGETILYGGTPEIRAEFDQKMDMLNKLKSELPKYLQKDLTNDDVKMYIESTCTENGCFPVENCISYQQIGEHIRSLDSKYIVLNHVKYYDDEDNLVVDPNICFEFEEGDVFHVNMTVVEDNDKEHVYVEPHGAHVMRYNEYFYNLKLKHSRDFFAKIKSAHGNCAFDATHYNGDVGARLGIKESIENGILDVYPVLYEKNRTRVYHKKFTVIVKGDDKAFILKYT
jgi:methionine aminopeptidase